MAANSLLKPVSIPLYLCDVEGLQNRILNDGPVIGRDIDRKGTKRKANLLIVICCRLRLLFIVPVHELIFNVKLKVSSSPVIPSHGLL